MESKSEMWYCSECRTEAIKRNPKHWHLDNSMQHLTKDLVEYPKGSGYYLCKKHYKILVPENNAKEGKQ